jgi:uncharacterized RDD family membrane protein YckC
VYVAPTHAARLGRVPASFLERLGALLLDTALLLAVTVPLWIGGIVFVASGWETHPGTCTTTTGLEYDCTELSGDTALRLLAVIGLGLVAIVAANVLYFARLEGERGQTVGQRVLGIRVVDVQTGGPIGFGRALGRLAVRVFLSGQLFGLGYLWMLWDDNKQTWHDKVVNSIVVKA